MGTAHGVMLSIPRLVDSMLSATRDMAAAQRFFRDAVSVLGKLPRQVTSDGHNSYPRAIREVLGPQGRTSQQRLPEPANRAGPPWREAAILPNAGVRWFPLSPAFLSSLRGN
jgi:hypothetical protein